MVNLEKEQQVVVQTPKTPSKKPIVKVLNEEPSLPLESRVCSTCRFCRKEGGKVDGEYWKCFRPDNPEVEINPITGDPNIAGSEKYCTVERKFLHLCGPSAQYWKSKKYADAKPQAMHIHKNVKINTRRSGIKGFFCRLLGCKNNNCEE